MPIGMLCSFGAPTKRYAGVTFVFNEEDEFVSDVNHSGKTRKSNVGERVE